MTGAGEEARGAAWFGVGGGPMGSRYALKYDEEPERASAPEVPPSDGHTLDPHHPVLVCAGADGRSCPADDISER